MTIVRRNNIVWKLGRGYCLCYCKNFSVVKTPQSAQNLFFPKSAVHYLCYLKSSNTIDQRKTTNTEKYFYPWLTSFNLKLSCTLPIFVKTYCKYCTFPVQTGWDSHNARNKLIDCWISIFKISKAKSGIPEYKNEKKIMWTSIFFLPWDNVLSHHHANRDITVVSIASVFF